MIEEIAIRATIGLDEYASVVHLASAVAELRAEAAQLVPKLQGRTVWMLNSTARGGGVAEMLPRMISTLRELGVDARWVVMGTERAGFFDLTKRLHNLIHASGEPHLGAEDRALYDAVSDEVAAELAPRLHPDDLVVVHDPQPAGVGARLAAATGVSTVWRSHIGLDEDLPQTRAAWGFLEPYLRTYDRAVFSASEYIPRYLSRSVAIIPPGIDPLGSKNRELSEHELTGVLVNSGLLAEYAPVVRPAFAHSAERLQPDGSFAPATQPDELGLQFRPVVCQISRWDKLKGFKPLLDAFVALKRRNDPAWSPLHARRIALTRLVLAGPEPAAVQDDPEAQTVLDELCRTYASLDESLKRDVALLSLPMASLKENALMVNALQRCSTVVVQNSIREGFGLTATEAMWKRSPVLASSACGLRQQVRHGIDGLVVDDPTDPQQVAEGLQTLLVDPDLRQRYARSAQRRVHDEFLVFTQLRRWLRVLAQLVAPPSRPPPSS